jgi:hypothetical protein
MIKKAYRTFISASLGYILAMILAGWMISLHWIPETMRMRGNLMVWPLATALCYFALYLTSRDTRSEADKKADALAERRARSGYRPPDQYN